MPKPAQKQPARKKTTAKKKPTTKKPRTPPTPKVYQLAFGVKITTLAFRRQDAIRQMKALFEAMTDTINAAGGPALEMETPKLLVTKELGVLDLDE